MPFISIVAFLWIMFLINVDSVPLEDNTLPVDSALPVYVLHVNSTLPVGFRTLVLVVQLTEHTKQSFLCGRQGDLDLR